MAGEPLIDGQGGQTQQDEDRTDGADAQDRLKHPSLGEGEEGVGECHDDFAPHKCEHQDDLHNNDHDQTIYAQDLEYQSIGSIPEASIKLTIATEIPLMLVKNVKTSNSRDVAPAEPDIFMPS